MKIYENYGFGKWREGCGTIRASGGDNGGGSEMLLYYVWDARGNGAGGGYRLR